MRKLIILAMAILLFGCLTERKIQRWQESAVLVRVNNGAGTGIVVAPNLVLTVAHALDGEMFILGKPIKMLKVDKENDLLLFRTEHTFKHWLKLADELPKIGEEVFIIGHGWNNRDKKMLQLLTFGKISKRENGNIWIDAKVIPGFSGGPVINKRGEVVAMVQILFAYSFPSVIPIIPGPMVDLFAIGKDPLVIREFLSEYLPDEILL